MDPRYPMRHFELLCRLMCRLPTIGTKKKEYSPVSEEKIAVAEEDYHNQESLVESSNETGQRVSDATNPPSDPPLQHFHFEPLSEEKKAAAAQCYLDQDNYIRIAQDLLNDLRRVKKNNSDVSPKHRLMSCLVQKTMSTVMSAIFCFLVRENELCEGRNEFHTVQNAQRALGLPDLDQWRFTVVTREPVDRFLSGFIDRCLRVGDDCFGCYGNMTCFLEEEYERAGAYALADKHGLRKHWPGMEDMHVSESSLRYISESLRSGRTAHSTVVSEARTYLEQRVRSSPYLMEMIVRLFYYDYKLFKYELPDLSALENLRNSN
ncbi:unnamed protein product [Heligmosomoides polygyrus]|uniref:Carbohydrate sulfotransferase n=1 Tax=Heligmosomoides polygyrus TaxID=6339 RepID=A0A183FPB1_HELPZ|nr:unnamed protein product [Heligmosomoides polygyrus]